MNPKPRPITDREFRLAENPLWDERRDCLFWTDIDAGELWRWSPDATGAGSAERIYQGPRVGGFTLQRDGALLLFRETDIALLDDDADEPRPILPFEDPGCERFNDVIAAPDGSALAGAIGRSDTSGGLFHLSTDGALRELFRGTRIPNGMAFTLDKRWLFYTCSTSATISRFAFDAATSTLSGRQVIHRAAEEQGTPDGLTVDHRGDLWSARWAGSRVLRLRFDGVVIGELAVPTPNVTSVAFGGPDRRTLFITTAGGPVYACEPGVAGPSELRSAITP